MTAAITGHPPTPRSVSSRAQLAATLTGVPPQASLHPRAQLAAAGRDPLREHLGQPRTFSRPVAGIPDLVGQLVQLPDGRALRVLGLEVLQPDTEHQYAGAHSYGCAADATFVTRPRPLRMRGPVAPLGRPSHAVAVDAAHVAGRDTRPVRPHLPEPVLTRQQQGAAQIDATEKKWNGTGAMIEGYGLLNKSITPVNNSAFRVAQRVNRLAGRKVIVPSHLASGAARVVRTVAPTKLARLGGKFGKFAGPAGMGLTAINIRLEVKANEWDAHTAIDGVMFVVTGVGLVAAGVAASPVFLAVGAVIVVYGVLDFVFDIGEKVIDPVIGRDSKFNKEYGVWGTTKKSHD